MKFELEQENIRYAVIGDPVAHSVSPPMQNAGFMAAGLEARYGKFHVTPDELPEFVRFARKHLNGFNATVPHKHALIPLLDEIAPAARAAGSVNTVIVRDGRLYGDSTDGYGLETALHEAFGFEPARARVLLLGAGGAAQAVAFDLAHRGVAELFVVNRTFEKAVRLAAALRETPAKITPLSSADEAGVLDGLRRSAVTIQATSSGLHPEDEPPIPLAWLRSARAVFDMIYRPTKIQEFVRSCGIPCADGRLMLLHQGARSFTLWTNQPAPLAAMRAALAAALR